MSVERLPVAENRGDKGRRGQLEKSPTGGSPLANPHGRGSGNEIPRK